MTLTPAPIPSVTIAEMVELFDAPDEALPRRAVAVPTLPPFWRETFEKGLKGN